MKITKEAIKRTEEYLGERYEIMKMCNPERPEDVIYYNGMLNAIERLGIDWKRENGKHKLF